MIRGTSDTDREASVASDGPVRGMKQPHDLSNIWPAPSFCWLHLAAASPHLYVGPRRNGRSRSGMAKTWQS